MLETKLQMSACDVHAMQVSFTHYIMSLTTSLPTIAKTTGTAISPTWDTNHVRPSFCSFILNYHLNITNSVCICKQQGGTYITIPIAAVLVLTWLLSRNLGEAWQADQVLMLPTRGLLIIYLFWNNQ